MEDGVKTESCKKGITLRNVSFILILVVLGFCILLKMFPLNYGGMIAISCAIVLISIMALITAIVVIRKYKLNKVLPIVIIVVASFIIFLSGLILLDSLLAVLMKGYFMGR